MHIDPRGHRSCSPKQDSVYGIKAKRKDEYRINPDSAMKAIELLFVRTDEKNQKRMILNSKQVRELMDIAENDFRYKNTLVWIQGYSNDEFNKFLNRYSLSIGRMEICISGDGTVRFYKDYSNKPEIFEVG